MRALPIILAAAAAVFTLAVGASAAPVTDPVRAIEDAAVSVLTGPEPADAPAEASAPAGPVTATSTGNTLPAATPTSDPLPGPYPTEFPDAGPGLIDECMYVINDPVLCSEETPEVPGNADVEVPSLESQIEDCVAQEGNRAWCEDKIRHGAVD